MRPIFIKDLLAARQSWHELCHWSKAEQDGAAPIRDPDSLIEGHAIWRPLTAGTVAAIYGYFDAEVEA